MTDQAITDELAIRRLLDEYCLRLELDAFEDWLDRFTDDTIYEVYGKVLEGKQALADLLRQAPHGVHLPGAARITLDDDRARTVQSYAFVSTATDDWNAGWYLRDIVRTDAGWKIARTVVRFARKEALPENARARRLDYPVRFD